MSTPEISSLLAAANAAANAAVNSAVNVPNGKRSIQREAELNSARIDVVANKLALFSQSSGLKDDARLFFQLCLSLARGIDYGVANHEAPEKASKLPLILKQVCGPKNEFFLQAAIMVLMISVKNACKMGWFNAKDTEELLALASEVFSTMGELSSEVSVLPTVSTIMLRFYPQFKMGHVIASLEVKPGYGTYLLDFHISKNIPYSPDEKIRLFVSMKDNIDTSSCLVSPQKVNLLLNGKAVDKRTNISMDQGPQFPTAVNHQLKYGTNLLQAVGHFSGHYIIVIAFMSIIPPSTLPVPQDYVPPDVATLSSESDSEIIEGSSRISLHCPISCKRIGTPVKGHLCKHYQCFGLSNYLELNSKRPSWRCPQCNQSVCFTDLRVDQRMAKVLQEVGDNVSEVIISVDGSWTAAPTKNHKYESNDKASTAQLEQFDRSDSFDTDTCKVYDLTEDDNEMEIEDNYEPIDIKPIIHQNVQNQALSSNLLVPNSLLSETLLSNINSGLPTGSSGISLNRLPDSFQGTISPTSSTANAQFSASNSPLPSSVLSNDFGGFQGMLRNVTRTPSAIQALGVPMPSPHQPYSRPIVSTHTTNMPSSQFQVPIPSSTRVDKPNGMSIELEQHIHRTITNALRTSNIPISQQNRPTPRVVGYSAPNLSANTRMPQMPQMSQMPQMHQRLSQPPHLRSSTQVPQNHGPQGVSNGGVGVTMEPIQLMAHHPPPQTRQHPQTTPPQIRQHLQTTPPPQTQPVRMASHSPVPQNTGPTPPPQAVSRTENLIDLQSEQNWRPIGRMRGALTGQAYSDALSQFLGQVNQSDQQAPSPRPPGSQVPLPLSPHLQAMANRMHPQVSQVLNRPPNNSSNGSGPSDTRL